MGWHLLSMEIAVQYCVSRGGRRAEEASGVQGHKEQ